MLADCDGDMKAVNAVLFFPLFLFSLSFSQGGYGAATAAFKNTKTDD